MCLRALLVTTFLVVSSTAAVAHGDPAEAPWRTRRRVGVRHNRRAAQLVSPEDWPEEPPSPDRIDQQRFAEALRRICGWMPPRRRQDYAQWIATYANTFAVDPFLLAALTYRMGRCRPDAEDLGGVGLTLIPERMYWGHIEKRAIRYAVRKNARWTEHTLGVPKFPFTEHRLRQAEANLYFAAAWLAAWKAQHASVDGAFEQHPHRHFVSHFIWGDRVRTDRSEDRILTDRRRLLEYYGARHAMPPQIREGLSMRSPLDGAPRVVSSFLGSDRDEGDRSHRGVDIESELGEPVRAVADGKVVFAGVDLPGRRSNENMKPEQIAQVPRNQLGRGGRFVCIVHPRRDASPLRSCYMHLEDVFVTAGQQVSAGMQIGTVGRTGMKRSAPHLHLELHDVRGLLDPRQVLRGFLLGRPPG